MPEPRLLQAVVDQDLAEKMVLLAGPRQVGKTTLTRAVLGKRSRGVYLNWDQRDDRRDIRAARWPVERALVVLDERLRQVARPVAPEWFLSTDLPCPDHARPEVPSTQGLRRRSLRLPAMPVVKEAAQALYYFLTAQYAFVDDVARHAIFIADQQGDQLRQAEIGERLVGIGR